MLAKRQARPQLFGVMSGPLFCLLPHRSAIAVSGADRVGFLQGLISNDTTKVGPGRAIWAALLTPQGRFLNDMFVVEGGNDTLLLETERERAAALTRKLSLYKLRSRIAVEDRSAAVEVAVAYGDEASRALDLEGAVSFVDPRLAALGVRVIAPVGTVASLLVARGFAEAPLASYESLRLSLGVPDGSRDLTIEKALLLESGFDELNGIDWAKGCYMGQELTARTKYRGLVKRRLFPVRVEGAPPPPGTIVRSAEQEVGELRSSVDDKAIAMLQLDAARSGARLTAAGVRIVPIIPDWMHLPS